LCWSVGFQETRSCCRHRSTMPSGSRSPGACLLVQATRSHGSFCRHRGSKPVDSGSAVACLPGASFQEPQELLVSGENKVYGQQEPCGLLTGSGYLEPRQLLQAQGTQARGSRNPGACLQVQATRSHCSCCWPGETSLHVAGALWSACWRGFSYLEKTASSTNSAEKTGWPHVED
jgi:hypothetical protein